MAGDARAPGDVRTIERYFDRKYRYKVNYNKPGDSSSAYGAFTTVQQLCYRSRRPSYAKGSVITLPGGDTFIKSTNYIHDSVQLKVDGIYDTEFFERKDILGWFIYGAQDNGREVGSLINQNQAFIQGSGIPLDARNEAVTKALNKIADQKVNLGENLATAGQTFRMFSSKAKLLNDALHYAKRVKSWRKFLQKSARDLRRAGPLTVAASEYLAYIYGLKPLCEDVYTLAKLFQEQTGKTLLLKSQAKSHRMVPARPKQLGPFSYSSARRTSGESRQRVSCTIWARIDPNWQGLRSLNQLGLLNPLGLAWDLVPYSFVVDWFLPVGPVLYALTAPAGLIFVDGSIACRNSETIGIDWRATPGAINYDESKKGPKFENILRVTMNYELYTRQVLTSWPTPGLWFDQNPLRGDRPLKALALSIIALSKSRSPIR